MSALTDYPIIENVPVSGDTAEMMDRIRQQLVADFRLLIMDARSLAQLEEAKIGVSFAALTPDERGELENLIASRMELTTKAPGH